MVPEWERIGLINSAHSNSPLTASFATFYALTRTHYRTISELKSPTNRYTQTKRAT